MDDEDDLRFSVIEEDSESGGDFDDNDGVGGYDDDDLFGGDDEISARKAHLRKKGSSSSLGAAVVNGKRHLEDIKQIMGGLKIVVML